MNENKYTRFVVLLSNIPGIDVTESLIRSHVQYLKSLEHDGKLEMCGPFTDYKGGMVILRVGSFAEAREIAEADPFVKGKVETFEIRTWELSCEENNHLGMG